MKRFACLLVLASLGLGASAQTDSLTSTNPTLRELEKIGQEQTKSNFTVPVFQYMKENNIFQHLDVSVALGSSGIGFDVASPVTVRRS